MSKLSYNIANSGSMDETEKLTVIETYTKHVILTKQEREVYRNECLESKKTCRYTQCSEGAAPCSMECTVHYSWDYAQQVHFPHHSTLYDMDMVGPLIFKTPRKYEVFGICWEGTGKQTFYLIDESESVGKGANSVVSMISSILTIVQDRTKITLYCGIHCGELLLVCTCLI